MYDLWLQKFRLKYAVAVLWMAFGAMLFTADTRAGDDAAEQGQDPISNGSFEPLAWPEFETPNWMQNMKTLGGRQFWGDVQFFHQWRIQQNAVSGHYRLLDGGNYRRASGTLDECRKKLAEIRQERELPLMKGKAVLLVHGIIRSSKSFQRMHKSLKDAGYEVFGFDYPSTRVSITQAADYLHQAISSLEGIDEINIVAHSMGGLVTRAYLEEHRDPRIQRMVMMGVPNMGAQMADRVKGWGLYRAIYGPAGQELVSDPEGLIARLPTPDFEFGIIAGGSGSANGYNRWVSGDDDGTVSVRSTRLPGASDFIQVRSLHSFLMMNATVQAVTVRYLQTGSFREDGTRQPISVEPSATTETGEMPPRAVPEVDSVSS